MLATGAAGPLAPSDLASFRCSEAEALVAAYVGRSWGLARNPKSKGILAGKPAYEAWEMFCSRVRAARTLAPSWPLWWLRLLEALRVKPEQVPQDYALTWESAHTTLPAWATLKNDQPYWNRVILGAGLMAREPGWRWQYLTLSREWRGEALPSYLAMENDDAE
jgi:hypothetical protein